MNTDLVSLSAVTCAEACRSLIQQKRGRQGNIYCLGQINRLAGGAHHPRKAWSGSRSVEEEAGGRGGAPRTGILRKSYPNEPPEASSIMMQSLYNHFNESERSVESL